MTSHVRTIAYRIGILGELLGFLWQNKLWWAIPLILVIGILMLFVLFGQTTGLAPFIYPLF